MMLQSININHLNHYYLIQHSLISIIVKVFVGSLHQIFQVYDDKPNLYIFVLCNTCNIIDKKMMKKVNTQCKKKKKQKRKN